MAVKQFGKDWTKSDTLKSMLWFLLHWAIFAAIAACMLFWKELGHIGSFMKEHAANNLYALFSVFLIITIMYFYYLFEDKQMIASGKNITMLFLVMDFCFILSWVIGKTI